MCVAGLAAGIGIAHATRSDTSGARVPLPLPLPVRSSPLTATEPLPAAETAVMDGTGEAMKDGMLITGATRHRLVLFTFDDGPDVHTTPHLLDLLDQENVRAVFFVSAYRITGDTPRTREQAAIAREALRRGHVVGSHGLDHLHFTRREVNAVEQIDGAAT